MTRARVKKSSEHHRKKNENLIKFAFVPRYIDRLIEKGFFAKVLFLYGAFGELKNFTEKNDFIELFDESFEDTLARVAGVTEFIQNTPNYLIRV